LASWRKPREAAGKQKLKDHQKLCAGTARDYSTTFGAGCKGPSFHQPAYPVNTRNGGMEEDSTAD
jgi:hypothetical protein